VPLILIVDDNKGNRKLARDVLSIGGFDTLEAATGVDAIALALEHGPDVVLMDIRLPDMDGTEAARKLGNDERTAGIPVVAMSALSREGNDNWLEGAGFAGWLGKPIHVATFAEQVRSYCSDATR
jgi:two-component system cell cycle response regulator DivK